MTDAARAFARGALAQEGLFFQQEDAARAAAGQVIGGAGSHDAAANDEDVGVLVHGAHDWVSVESEAREER